MIILSDRILKDFHLRLVDFLIMIRYYFSTAHLHFIKWFFCIFQEGGIVDF